MRQLRTVTIVGIAISVVLFSWSANSRARATCPSKRVYTLDSHFAEGVRVNVDYDSEYNRLKLTHTPRRLFPYINVACSGRGTVVRLYVGTSPTDPPRVVGEYKTAPAGMLLSPSRTTVDQRGNVWVANREECTLSTAGCQAVHDTSGQKGSITRIALIIGGDDVWQDGLHYIVETPEKPITYCSARIWGQSFISH